MAGRRTHVPKFGNWDANDHMPYTVVFDNARQGRGKPINPNDPAENPSMFPAGKGAGGGNNAPAGAGRRPFNPNDPEDLAPLSNHGQGRPQERVSQERPQERPQERSQERPQERPQERVSQERQQQERHPERPVVQQPGTGAREGSGSTRQPHLVAASGERRRASAGQSNLPSRGPSAELAKRTGRDNGIDRNVESPSTSFSDQSPSHPAGVGRYEGSQGARAATRLGANSPAWDPTRRKSTGEEAGQMFAPATPTRSRFRNGNTKEEAPAKGTAATLPKFGDWNVTDPGSGDGFTVIFNNQRNEKKSGGPVNMSRTPDKDNGDLYASDNSGYPKGHSRKSSWWCCFSPDVKS